ncbi:hypothetical protein EON83_15185 [bacterium]|nr:MAG: hypothetical protein EON83_15185 [bacterium]
MSSSKKALYLGVPAILGALGLCAVAQGKWTLSVGGHTISTNARNIGGTTYVPIGDVAKALNMRVSVKGNKISLLPAGGATQVGKIVGNINEDLSSGLYGFKVLGVTRAESYDLKYPTIYQRAETVKAKDGQELVIVSCRLKNQTQKIISFPFSINYKPTNTSLTDLEAQSYAPLYYDAAFDAGGPFLRKVLPAASLNVVLVFAVPKDTKIKDVVYGMISYDDWVYNKPAVDFRVHVQDK